MRFILSSMLMTCAFIGMSQINFGVYRTPDGSTDYHHLTRAGTGAVLYVNQESSDAAHPILRLSSGTVSANVDVKFTVENNGYVGIGTITPTSNLTVQGSGSLVGRYDPSKAYFQITNGGGAMLFDNNEITSSQGLYLSSSFNQPTVFRNVSATDEEELMRITSEGKIGIGIAAPTAKLSIYQTGTLGKVFDPSKAYLELTDGAISMLLDGNEIHSNQNLILGSAYANDISFNNIDDNGSDQLMVIKGDGRVGIGTSTPSVGLELEGGGEQWIYVNQGTIGGIRIGSSNEDRMNVLYRDNSSDRVTLRAGHDHGEIAFIAGGTDSERMRIVENGNIGIGTNSPDAKLSIIGSSTLAGDFDASKAYLELTDGSISMLMDGNEITTNQLLALSSSYDHPIIFRNVNETDDEELVRINSDGGVGIGTQTTGLHKLAVDGSIGAREIVIEANAWPDYVFDENYDLKSLEEVKTYVQDNGHLPEVPSTQEVEKEGVALGHMNELLLQKIEELTLYLIDQNEQLKSQIEENKSQRLQISNLQVELSVLKKTLKN